MKLELQNISEKVTHVGNVRCHVILGAWIEIALATVTSGLSSFIRIGTSAVDVLRSLMSLDVSHIGEKMAALREQFARKEVPQERNGDRPRS